MALDYKYKAKLIRIIDGDTIEAELDLGFRISRRDIFRLEGINAPEHDPVSTEALSALITGKDIIIESHKAEKYGRWLATIWLPGADGGMQSANQLMVQKGMAVPYMVGK